MNSSIKQNSDCLHQLFEYQAFKTPNAIALSFEDDQLTYAQLNRRANALAVYCLKNGFKMGMKIGISMDLSPDLIIAVLATHKLGCTCVAVDVDLPNERKQKIINTTALEVMFTKEKFLMTDLGTSTSSICLDTISKEIENVSCDNPLEPFDPGIPAYLIYTSGSTGAPKGIVMPHKASINRFLWMINEFDINATDTFLMKANISYRELYTPLMAGAHLVLCKSGNAKDPRYLIDLIKKHTISVINVVPSLLKAMLDIAAFDECISLKQVFCSGEVLSFKLKQLFLSRSKASLYNCWGTTETHIITYFNCSEKNISDPVPIGKPSGNVDVLILDDDLVPVQKGMKGQLFISGDGLAEGYLNQPVLTNNRFIANPFNKKDHNRLYVTGDIGRCLEDGNLEYSGRADRQIKLRGNRVEPEEIEYNLYNHPDVKECAVLSVPVEPSEMKIVAFVVLKKQQNIQNLRSFLRNKLPEYMIPSTFYLIEKMPLNGNYKIDYADLQKRFAHEQARETELIPPRNRVEETIVEVWQKILNITEISIKDNFIDLGGHSLQLIQVVMEIEQKLMVHIPLQNVMEDSLEDLAKLCQKLNQSAKD